MGKKTVKNMRMRKSVAVPAAALAVVMAGGAAYAATQGGWGNALIGRQADGSVLTATNQKITPAGTATEQSGRPMTMAVAPDGKTAVNETWDGSGQFTVTDLVNHKVLQQLNPSQGWGSSYGGLLYSPDGKTLWAAQPGNLQKFAVNTDGTLATPVTVPMPGANGNDPIPAGLAYSPDGKQILATFNGSNTLAVLDAESGAVIRQIPVGNAPRDVVVEDGHAFVANQGGRPAQPGDKTNDSYGTKIVTNDENGSPSTGSVSEVDLATGTVVRSYETGLAPSALLVHGDNIFVANSNSDTVSVLDAKTGKVGQTINVNPLPGAPASSSPNSLTMLDDTHLAVSLGQANAVAVYEFKDQQTPATFQGLIPTGWYPGTVQYDKALGQLVVAAQKGEGSLGAPGANGGHTVYSDLGLVSTVPTPTPEQLPEMTKQVWANNQWTEALADLKKDPSQGKAPVAIPRRDGDSSEIKHVFMIVKENRTYDQVLGDDSRGNGDPALAEFGGKTTPNHHALTSAAGPLLDNTYSSGTMSADGHQWLTQATVDEYLTRSIGNYDRSYPYNGGDAMAYSSTGFLWDNAAAHGVSAKDWGEYTNNWTDNAGDGDNHTWTQWYQNTKAQEAGQPATIPADQYHASTDVPSLSKILHPQFPGFQLQVPDQYRADVFLKDLKQAETDNNLPQLNVMTLPTDHTAGTDPSQPTPSAMVADNDLAVGRIIDGISHSKYGKDSAVFVMEDDSQAGVDHVDGHRQPAMVWSPFAKKGAVVNNYYTQLNIVRTIEQILALPPMTQMDLAAQPMFDAFTDKADTTPYTAQPNQIPLDTLNGSPAAAAPAAAQPAAQAWADWSKKQDWKGPDRANPARLNHADWYAAHNFTQPYPGEDKILTPDEVNAGTAQAPAKASATDTDG
ncbi:bifunctional YncE family protein/alkaline phosphatase family protein [Arthrobacter liuii]|uniref:bifunctional YncE family protein/alkaline phosphatase family protein n=1 Tax=Arthrobacter liuii TaxID=1476996 RepID=UPI0035E7E3D9